ncbi:unnamed protein product [Rotaria magnacalcarata]|uniref:Exostosin GT47 domain-containing protein n=1 Tax=Rotaria magnacalcarata TaxID=392030 RepID=A0A816CPU1_9BILA|nr:unnamed protein product [Rotaria magnacalcarata]CAF3851632.1 unnamed protein product [Rotaria magnacalcarata]
MIKSFSILSHLSQRVAFLVVICFVLCFVQFTLILQLISESPEIERFLSLSSNDNLSTILNCTKKLKCPNNITRFSIHIDENIQYPNLSYVRSPVFTTILDTIRTSSYYTNDSTSACIHIAPVDTIDRDRRSKNGYYTYFIEQRLNFFREWSDPNKIHLIFNHYTGTWPLYRRTLDFTLPSRHILALTSLTTANYNCLSHVTFPLFHSDYPSNLTNKFSSTRTILLSFKGKSYEDVQHHRTFFRHLNNNHDIIIKYTDNTSSYDQHEYTELLRQSYFCLVPSGRRLYSYRFLEVLQYGCIPVITTNDNEFVILPFSEIINWSQTIIVYSNSPLSLLPYYLKKIGKQQRIQMQKECIDIWLKYFSSIPRIILTTLDILNDRFISSLPS